VIFAHQVLTIEEPVTNSQRALLNNTYIKENSTISLRENLNVDSIICKEISSEFLYYLPLVSCSSSRNLRVRKSFPDVLYCH